MIQVMNQQGNAFGGSGNSFMARSGLIPGATESALIEKERRELAKIKKRKVCLSALVIVER